MYEGYILLLKLKVICNCLQTTPDLMLIKSEFSVSILLVVALNEYNVGILNENLIGILIKCDSKHLDYSSINFDCIHFLFYGINVFYCDIIMITYCLIGTGHPPVCFVVHGIDIVKQ